MPPGMTAPEHSEDLLRRERRGRLVAERRLAIKEAELLEANAKLDAHALALRERALATQARAEAAESGLQHEAHRAAITERRLWDAVEAIGDGFAVFDRDGRLVAANSAYLSPFEGLDEVAPGIAFERLLELICEEGLIDLGEMGASDWIDMMRHRLSRAPIEDQPLRLYDGTELVLSDRRTPDGDLVTLAVNVTAARRREEELADARRAAEAASAAKSAFLAAMSHEIRTPLNGVVGTAELLSGTALDEEQALYVQTIRDSGEVLLEMVNDVLDFSRIEAGRLELREGEVDLAAIARQVGDVVRPQLDAAGVTLELSVDPPPPLLRGDAGRIRQVLTNLAGNAAKFTARGRVGIAVTVGEGPGPSAEARLVVTDTGPGIPREHHRRIFEEFAQVPRPGAPPVEGSGLGLAICRRLVAAMGGRIELRSAPGEGSTFTVTLPLPLAERPEEAAQRHPRVLAAEDNRTNRLIFERMLAGLPIDLTVVEDGAQALEAFRKGGWSLVFLDISMPVMDGREAAEAMRAFEAATGAAPIPIVAMTAHVLADEVEAILASGIDEVLTKPLRKQTLQDAVTAAIGGRAAA